MRFFFKVCTYLILFINFYNISNAEQSVKFVNIDLLVNNTKIGNQMLDKISNLDKENIEKLKSFEVQIKNKQEEIKLKKNVISEIEFEKEVTDLNKLYLQDERLSVELMGSGYTWLDTGTHQSLLEASRFIETIEQRQGLKIACIEEIAFRLGYIDNKQLEKLSKDMLNNEYGNYLMKILEKD